MTSSPRPFVNPLLHCIPSLSPNPHIELVDCPTGAPGALTHYANLLCTSFIPLKLLLPLFHFINTYFLTPFSVPLFADSAAAKTQSHIIFLSFSCRSLYSDPNCNFVLNM